MSSHYATFSFVMQKLIARSRVNQLSRLKRVFSTTSQLDSIKLTNGTTEADINFWHRNGYLLKKSLFDGEEMSILQECISIDNNLKQYEYGVYDNDNKKSNMVLWNRIGNDTYGNFIASRRMYNIIYNLLNYDTNMPYTGEIYHYHTKLMLKHPKKGGSFIWHQDYGYWYQNYFIFPNLLTAFVAIDKCTKENGCLQVM